MLEKLYNLLIRETEREEFRETAESSYKDILSRNISFPEGDERRADVVKLGDYFFREGYLAQAHDIYTRANYPQGIDSVKKEMIHKGKLVCKSWKKDVDDLDALVDFDLTDQEMIALGSNMLSNGSDISSVLDLFIKADYGEGMVEVANHALKNGPLKPAITSYRMLNKQFSDSQLHRMEDIALGRVNYCFTNCLERDEHNGRIIEFDLKKYFQDLFDLIRLYKNKGYRERLINVSARFLDNIDEYQKEYPIKEDGFVLNRWISPKKKDLCSDALDLIGLTSDEMALIKSKIEDKHKDYISGNLKRAGKRKLTLNPAAAKWIAAFTLPAMLFAGCFGYCQHRVNEKREASIKADAELNNIMDSINHLDLQHNKIYTFNNKRYMVRFTEDRKHWQLCRMVNLLEADHCIWNHD